MTAAKQLAEPTMLAVVGDTHGNLSWVANDVIPYAVKNGATRIMQVGDFGFIWPGNGLTKLNRVLDRNGLDLHFLPGNHEDHTKLDSLAAQAEADNALSPEGHWRLATRIFYTGRVAAWTWGNRRYAAVGGATSIDRQWRTPGRSWWPEEVLTEAETEQAKTLGPVDVLFSHDAPSDFPAPLKPDLASTANRQRMTDIGRALRPKLWFHGHYHWHGQYAFHHAGYCSVISLDCDDSPRKKGIALLNLAEETAVAS